MKIFLALALSFLSLVAFAAPAEKEWTFLVYLNGDNNLNSYGDKDTTEMMKVGSTENVNIIVLRDFGARLTSKIYYVEKGNLKIVLDYKKNVDTGDYNTLVDFFKYAKQNYPAKRFVVDIWNHGNGWMNKSVDGDKGISYDDTSGNHISTAQLGVAMAEMKAFNDGKNIDVLGMDACLMTMGEVIHEVNQSVDYVLGSEETEPGDGWDYVGALNPMVKNPSISTEDFLKAAVKAYVVQYGTSASTQSAISTEKFEKVIPLVNNFVAYAKTLLPANKTAFVNARNQSRKFAISAYKDYIHFIQLLNVQIKDDKLKAVSDELIKGLQNSLVANEQMAMPNANGISIWIPNYLSTVQTTEYAGLGWTKDTTWMDLINLILK